MTDTAASYTYLTASELAGRIKYDERTIREHLKDTVLLEGVHYIRPLGGRKILFLWEPIQRDLHAFSNTRVPAGERTTEPLAKVGVLLRDCAQQWLGDNVAKWTRSYRLTVDGVLNQHLLPRFGATEVAAITRAELLQFRSNLMLLPGKRGEALSPQRVNNIMNTMGAILREAGTRHGFASPFSDIKSLPLPKWEVDPFTLDEVLAILQSVRTDFRDYYTVRFLTGLRAAEIDGLKWQYVDLRRQLISVQETLVWGSDEVEGNEVIQRDIKLSSPVIAALQRQRERTKQLSVYVFCNADGQPLDHNNVNKRVWTPVLKQLGLRHRPATQTRTTTATLWLASGEAPDWVARQMGYVSTEMVFRLYGKYVRSPAGRGGSAFEHVMAPVLPDKEI